MLGIEILKRIGGGGSTVNLRDASVFGTQYAQWTIGFDGWTYKRRNSGAAVKDLSWINPQSGMSKYEVRATSTGPDDPPGTLDTWLSMGSSWTWGWVAPQYLQKDGEILVEIRTAVGHVVVDSATITIFASGLA